MVRLPVFLIAISLLSCSESETDENSNKEDSEVSSVVATETVAEEISSHTFETNSLSEGDETTTDDAEITSITFFETEHPFGKVFYPSESKYTFRFKNTGKFPLIISSATASCGCTVPNKPDEPIAPGAIGELDVIFRPKENQVGETVNKKITVTSNTEPKVTYLTITANVIEAMGH